MSLVRRDVATRFVVNKQIGPVVIATDTNTDGTGLDLAAYPGYKILAVCSTGTRTDGTFTFVVQGSSDDGVVDTYATLTPVDGSLAAITASNITREAAYSPSERYIRIRCTSASTTSGAPVSAYLILVPPGS